MADISTNVQIVIRRFSLPRRGIPMLGIGASLAAIFCLLGNAFKMAYADPYAGHGRERQVASDDDLEGRDPDW